MSPWHLWPRPTRQAATTGGERSHPESSRAAIALLQRPVGHGDPVKPLGQIHRRLRPSIVIGSRSHVFHSSSSSLSTTSAGSRGAAGGATAQLGGRHNHLGVGGALVIGGAVFLSVLAAGALEVCGVVHAQHGLRLRRRRGAGGGLVLAVGG